MCIASLGCSMLISCRSSFRCLRVGNARCTFLTSSLGRTSGVLISCYLTNTLPGLDTRELLQWIKAVPVCQRLRIIVTMGSDDPDIPAEALALGADAFFRKPVSFQQFLALGDLIKVVVCGHTQT